MGRRGCRLCLGTLFPCLLLSGLALIGLGIALYLKFPSVITDQVNEKVTIKKGHATYEQLQEPTIPIYKDFYFFNMTNAHEFHSAKGGVKPNLKEVGPYSYREYRTKVFIEDDNNTGQVINYTQTKIFRFNSTNSGPGLKESDKIYTINIPLVAAIDITKDSVVKRSVLFGLVETLRTKLYVCQNARDLAWNYTDSLIEALHIAHQYPEKYVTIQVNNSIFDRNVSSIYTGVGDISKIGQYAMWNGLPKLTIWPNKEHFPEGDPWPKGTGANCINGTEGFFFKPNLQEGDNLTGFVDDIQRSIDLKFIGKVSPMGLPAFRYGIKNSTFKSAFNEPENARWGSWCPDGMVYIGPTQVMEIPVYGSKPHFLDGDPGLLDSVVGLNPDREKHDTVIDVEPITGANLNFRRQLQVNVQVNKTSKFPMEMTSKIKGFNGTDSLYIPVLYVNEYAQMDAKFKQYLEQKGLKEVQIFDIAVPALFGAMLLFGAICLLVSLLTCAGFVSRSKRRNEDERSPLLNPSD